MTEVVVIPPEPEVSEIELALGLTVAPRVMAGEVAAAKPTVDMVNPLTPTPLITEEAVIPPAADAIITESAPVEIVASKSRALLAAIEPFPLSVTPPDVAPTPIPEIVTPPAPDETLIESTLLLTDVDKAI